MRSRHASNQIENVPDPSGEDHNVLNLGRFTPP